MSGIMSHSAGFVRHTSGCDPAPSVIHSPCQWLLHQPEATPDVGPVGMVVYPRAAAAHQFPGTGPHTNHVARS